jgi:soluble lytic murein transglycosylase-like protein
MNGLKPLGPQAMLARLAEFQAQVEPEKSPTVFKLPDSQPPALSGSISSEGSYAPLNPFGSGAGIQSNLTAGDLHPMIDRAAKEQGIETALLDALVQAESNYNPAAVSSKRAVGLTQLMPDTARSLGVTDPFDPAQNLRGGAKYLSQMLKQFDGDMPKAVAAYNAGPGAVAKYGGIPPYTETQNYVNKVIGLYRAKRGG